MGQVWLRSADASPAGVDAATPSSELRVSIGEIATYRRDTPRIFADAMSALAFAAVFAQPLISLVRDWWNLPEAGHGLLLAPVAIWLAWRSGIHPRAQPHPGLGLAVLGAAVFLRYVAALAAEPFATRESMMLALAGLTIFYWGARQILWWWLPFTLAVLTVPLPEIVTQTIALPLQFEASRMGAWLLSSRHVPVQLSGNIIRLPGRELFVTEACSGLRSLTALLSLAVLLGGISLRHSVSRLLLVALAIPIAIVLNGVRVFLTGFLVFFVSPAYGEGFLHGTEGMFFFVISFAALGVVAWLLHGAEGLAAARFRRNA